jgi:putative Holliday junction resolvase
VSRFESASRLAARSSLPKVGVVLALDYGAKRIGVACGDLGLRLAHPLETIKAAHRDRLFDRIAELIAEWKPTLLVVGFPTSLAGEEYELSREVRRFARELEARFHLPAELVDERLTSAEASLAMREAGVYGARQRPHLDQVAAQCTLQAFFDGLNASGS